MPDRRLPYYQRTAIEAILQADVAARHNAIDSEINDGIVLRDVATAQYYSGPVGASLALGDALPAYVLRLLEDRPTEARSEDLGYMRWELQIIEQENDPGETGLFPQEVLEERLTRMAVAVRQVFEDTEANRKLTTGGVAYSSGLIVERVVPIGEGITDATTWVRGIALFLRTPYSW